MRVLAILRAVVVLLFLQGPSYAQNEPADQQQLLDQGQLDQLVAPIALYPDPLLAQVLIAATYPLEVVQAERWVEANKGLKGDALSEALAKEDWDNSVKALAGVPDVLTMMNEDLDWTSKLGDAVLAQQQDVMDAVQRLRVLAQENGKLESNEQQTVTVKQEANVSQEPADQQAPAGEQVAPQQVIVIEPASPETVYVPYYEPSVVYGSWPYPDYPPYYFEPRPGYVVGGAIATGLAWSAGFAIGNAIWGDGFDWDHDNIRVDVDRKVNFNPNVKINNNVNVSNWQHNSVHRRGVNYKNTEVRNKFSNVDVADKKDDFRGRIDGDKKPDFDGKRPNVSDMEAALKDKAGGGKKPDLGDLKKPDIGGGKKPDLGDLKKSDIGGGKKPDLGGLKKPDIGGGKKPDLGNVKKPDLGGKKPDVGNLAAKKPDLGGGKKPDLGGGKKPDLKKPKVTKPAGNAFDRADGAKAKDFSKRGHASVGNRSATKMAARPGGGGGLKRGGGGGARRR